MRLFPRSPPPSSAARGSNLRSTGASPVGTFFVCAGLGIGPFRRGVASRPIGIFSLEFAFRVLKVYRRMW